jgi:ABC-2 type transport system ATP-binding protein
MTTILECSGLTKKYGSQKAVDNLNLKIERGRVYALLGPNGSGKSTFMILTTWLLEKKLSL